MAFILFSYSLVYKSKKLIGILVYFASLIFMMFAPINAVSNVDRAFTCNDFGGSWNYSQNKCDGARVESLNK
jgi:hypothetical protein